MKDLLKQMKFSNFLAWWTITLLLVIYFYSILLPERFANSPIVTQFTTMAGTVITLVLGFYFGGMAEKNKQKSSTEGAAISGEVSFSTTEKETENRPQE